MTRSPVGIAFFPVLLVGCLAADDSLDREGEPEPAFAIVAECTRRDCGDAFDECIRSVNSACSACSSTCLHGPCNCDSYCDARECLSLCPSTAPCLAHRFEVEFGAYDPAIAIACNSWVDKGVACGLADEEYLSDLLDCEGRARTERHASAAIYECYSRLECDGSGEECPRVVYEFERAEEVCAAMDACGEELFDCEDDELMAQRLGRLRPEVVDALDTCLALECEERIDCYRAWSGAV